MSLLTLGILAGGQSSRMGRDKALLEFGQGTLLDHVVARYRTGGPVLVSTRKAGPGDDGRYPVVYDTTEGEGPFVALASLLQAVTSPCVLVIGCDQPHLPPDIGARLLARLEPGDDGVILEWEGRLEPFPALIRVRCAGAILAHAQAGARKANGWIDVAAARPIPAREILGDDPGRKLASLNRPGDYAAARPRVPKV